MPKKDVYASIGTILTLGRISLALAVTASLLAACGRTTAPDQTGGETQTTEIGRAHV